MCRTLALLLLLVCTAAAGPAGDSATSALAAGGGDSCPSSTSEESCRAHPGAPLCSGRGWCVCGRCKCARRGYEFYTGDLCHICPSCPARCEDYVDCVRQRIDAAYLKKKHGGGGAGRFCKTVRIEVVDSEAALSSEASGGVLEQECTPTGGRCQPVFTLSQSMANHSVTIRTTGEIRCPSVNQNFRPHYRHETVYLEQPSPEEDTFETDQREVLSGQQQDFEKYQQKILQSDQQDSLNTKDPNTYITHEYEVLSTDHHEPEPERSDHPDTYITHEYEVLSTDHHEPEPERSDHPDTYITHEYEVLSTDHHEPEPEREPAVATRNTDVQDWPGAGLLETTTEPRRMRDDGISGAGCRRTGATLSVISALTALMTSIVLLT